MNEAPYESELPQIVARPRPVRMPSRSAQMALLVVGVVALFLFVMQLTAPGQNGLLSGRGASFGNHHRAPLPSVR